MYRSPLMKISLEVDFVLYCLDIFNSFLQTQQIYFSISAPLKILRRKCLKDSSCVENIFDKTRQSKLSGSNSLRHAYINIIHAYFLPLNIKLLREHPYNNKIIARTRHAYFQLDLRWWHFPFQ